MCVKSSIANCLPKKNSGITSINTIQSTNITAHKTAVNGRNGLHKRNNIDKPVKVITIAIIGVMAS